MAFPGLKELGLRFGYRVLQELPLPPGTFLTPADTEVIDAYNLHDLAIIRRVLEHLDAAIEMRRVLGLQCGVNLINHSDGRLGAILIDPAKATTMYVTLITHATLIDHYLANVEGVLLIDEPVKVWDQRAFNFTTSYRAIRELFIPQDIANAENYDGDVSPSVEVATQAVQLSLSDEGRRQFDDTDMKQDSIMGGKHRWIIEQAGKTSGRVFALTEPWNALNDPEKGSMDVFALLHPIHVAHFDETWMMAAYFTDLLVYQLWSHLYDVTWEFIPIADGWQRVTPLAERVSLYYVLENRSVTDTYLTNKGDGRRSRAMAEAVAGFYGEEEFIWSMNTALRESGNYAALPNAVTAIAATKCATWWRIESRRITSPRSGACHRIACAHCR
jgi:hypothetical protein